MDFYDAGSERHIRAEFRSTSGAILNGESIHARRDMSVEKPPDFRATHDDDLNLTHGWRDMSVTKPPHEIAESTIDHDRLYFSPRLSLSTAIPRRKHPVSSAPGSLSYVGPG